MGLLWIRYLQTARDDFEKHYELPAWREATDGCEHEAAQGGSQKRAPSTARVRIVPPRVREQYSYDKFKG